MCWLGDELRQDPSNTSIHWTNPYACVGNEFFVGRMAMLGVAFAAIGEVITGRGPLGQLSIETGSSITNIDGLVIFLIAFNFIAALLPAKGKLS